MKLRYITCSDPREQNSLESIVNLAKLPHAEVAVQCHPSKMDYAMPRNRWFDYLVRLALYTDMNLAIHINNEWSKDICANGKIPEIILDWITLEKATNQPVIKRIQLNMSEETAQNIKQHALAQIIHDFPNQEFILQYNNKTKVAVEKLHQTGAKFSLLFDASGGRGVAPNSWQKPIYDEHPMGYSGGMSPENVMQNLNDINMLVPQNRVIWIDAEGKLKPEGEKYMDVSKAMRYVKLANSWQHYMNNKTR